MRTHTSQFKDLIKEYGRQFTDTIYYNNTTYNGDHIFSVNYTVDTSLFKSVMQTLKIDTDIPMNVGDTLDYGISVVGASDEIRFNKFIVNKIEDQKDKKSKLITCYDNMVKSMVDYKSFYNATTDTSFVDDKNYYLYDLSEEKYIRYKGSRTGNPQTLGLYQSSFPMTIRNYLSAICNQLGLTFKNASDTFTNYNKQVTSEHYVDIDNNSMGYTFRDVLDDLAEATGSFICIDSNGQLELKTFTNTQDTINEDYFNDRNVNIGKKVGPYNVLVLSRVSDSDNIYRPTILPQNPIELKISDNPILEQDNREDFIDGIYNNINGLEFYLNDFTTLGILYYQIGDKYNVSIDNTTYPCLMLSDNIKRTTGLKEIIQTNEPPQSVTDYKYSSTTDKVEISSRNASIKVDKANASIEQIVEAVGDNGEVTSASIVQSINDSGSQIKLNADKIYINGVTFDNDQNMTINDGDINLIDTGSSSSSSSRVTITSIDETKLAFITSAGFYCDITTEYNGIISHQRASISPGGVSIEFSDENGTLTRVANIYNSFIEVFKSENGVIQSTDLYEDGILSNNFNLNGTEFSLLDNNQSPKFTVMTQTGNTTVVGTITAGDYSGSIWGRANDLATNNTSDTWIPVMVSGKWQHRVLPTTYNSTAPTLTGLTLNGDSGTNNVVKSGVIENQTSFESDTFKKQSFAGSTNVSGTWYNIINVRHRNGGGDGNSYGMQIRKLLTSNGPLEIRNQLSSTTWTGWQRVPVEFVLYDNATGTNGNVTLSETADHFTYLEIFFRITNADGSYNSQKIYLPNGKSTTLSIVHNYYTNNTAYSYLFSKRISISGTTITSVRNDYTQFRGTAINEHSTANNIYIVRVIGIR